MATRQNTIGAVHWGGMWGGTTGTEIALVIPAFFQGNHIPFLESILPGRLAGVLDYEVTIGFEPGELATGDRGTRYEPGVVAITGLKEPWPDAAAFRSAIDDAFVQAGEVEAEQMRKADALVAHLRAAPG